MLGLFDNFSIAFSDLSPVVGVYSLFVLGAGAAGPGYIWLMVPVVGFMLLEVVVATLSGSLALLSDAGHMLSDIGAIGASLWHLAKSPGDRRRLAGEPGLLPTAIEEFLRAYAPVTMARLVKNDMHWHGVDMKADDWILLSFPAANRDPAQFDRAAEVLIDREVNRHAAFGLGIHRCLGSHLARMELRVALEAWLERIGEFTLADPAAVTWAAGQIRGPRALPLRIR